MGKEIHLLDGFYDNGTGLCWKGICGIYEPVEDFVDWLNECGFITNLLSDESGESFEIEVEYNDDFEDCIQKALHHVHLKEYTLLWTYFAVNINELITIEEYIRLAVF